MKNETTGFSTLLEAPGNVVGTKELARLLGPKVFSFPKPSELIRILIDQVTDKNSIVLDSFAGSGTTGQAVNDLNNINGGNRRFILVEMESKIAKETTTQRLRQAGFKDDQENTRDNNPNKGICFRFCELGPTLFEANGQIRPEVKFPDLAAHVYFTETGQPLPNSGKEESPLLGVEKGIAVYLLYNGIMYDQGNTLTLSLLKGLPVFGGSKVIYGDGCKIGREKLRELGITFKQIPYEVKVR
jgi:adenine-specific DNA-methyltransferase